MKKTKLIYLVFEQGAGIILKAFEKMETAQQYVKDCEIITGFNCYEIQEITLQP